LGDVFLYCAMAVPTFFLWPLPLLHGRKVYTVVGLAVAMASQIPQAVAVSNYRSPDVASYRQVLFIFRALSGFAFGFVIINIQGALLDCFGASLQSHSPHGEGLDPYDVRRHGGGIGLWLGVWSFASLASISLGFMIGAFIINNANVMWGFWTCFVLILTMLLLNTIAPEVRRSAYRRTLTEMRGKDGDFSRVTRGEVKMHLEQTGPYWWGEEVLAGIKMNWLMVQQPGFVILAIYTSWVYAQFTMILMVSRRNLFMCVAY
jgi:MFS family permease